MDKNILERTKIFLKMLCTQIYFFHLAGADTVHPGVGDHLPGGDGESVHLVIAPEPNNISSLYTHTL